ncbi:hypothetical protein NL676_003643 [Syzygium grande]|nr:hypothetical protein NL676_003643 [Syzygium grande]
MLGVAPFLPSLIVSLRLILAPNGSETPEEARKALHLQSPRHLCIPFGSEHMSAILFLHSSIVLAFSHRFAEANFSSKWLRETPEEAQSPSTSSRRATSHGIPSGSERSPAYVGHPVPPQHVHLPGLCAAWHYTSFIVRTGTHALTGPSSAASTRSPAASAEIFAYTIGVDYALFVKSIGSSRIAGLIPQSDGSLTLNEGLGRSELWSLRQFLAA